MDEEIPYNAIVEQTTNLVIVTEILPLRKPPGIIIVYVNQAFMKVMGYAEEDVLGKSPRILQGEKTDKNILKKIRIAVEKKESVHFELLNYAKDQTEHWFDFSIIPINDKHGDSKYFVGIGHDITARKKMEEVQAQLSSLVEFSDEAIIGKNLDGTILSWNKAAENLYGYSAKEAIGANIKMLFPKDKQEEFQHIMHMVAANKHLTHFETLRVHKDGQMIPVSITITPIFSQGKVLGASVIARDITQQKLIEERLKHLAEHDALTGLINRPLFEDRLEQAILRANRQGQSVAVCFLDLDNFKQVNDIYGHTVGDLLLCATVKRLQTCIREIDTLARLGGDEFGLVLSNTTEQEAIKVVKKIVHSFAKEFLIENNVFHITLSIGVSLYPKDGNTSLIEKADMAMYYVKKQGKNNFKLFDDSISKLTS